MNEELTNIVLSLSSLGNKRIESLSKKVLKKMNFKSSKDLENLKDLCFWLYIYGYTNQFTQLYSILLSVSFTGNWNTWTQVEQMLALVYYASRKSKDVLHESKALAGIMQAETDVENIKNRCNGSLLEGRSRRFQMTWISLLPSEKGTDYRTKKLLENEQRCYNYQREDGEKMPF